MAMASTKSTKKNEQIKDIPNNAPSKSSDYPQNVQQTNMKKNVQNNEKFKIVGSNKPSDHQQRMPKNQRGRRRKRRLSDWVTGAMAEERQREELLRHTLIESVIYGFFVILVTFYAVEVANASWFSLTNGLRKQFLERGFTGTNGITLTFYDIRNSADLWFYLENHFIGTIFWEATYADPNSYPSIKNSDMNILYENRILGVPRVRQVKVKNGSCVVDHYFNQDFKNCYGTFSTENEDRSTFGPGDSTAWNYNDASETECRKTWGKVNVYGGGGFFVDLPKDKQKTEQLFRKLKDNSWITRGTRAVIIDFTTYNPNIHSFAVCKLLFEFSQCGGIVPNALFQSTTLKLYTNVPYDRLLLFIEILTYAFASYFIAEAIRDIVYFKAAYFTKFWTYINWIIIILCITNAIFSLLNIVDDVMAIEMYKAHPEKYGNFEYFREVHGTQKEIIATKVFFVYIKIFKYMNVNTTMGQVYFTLRKCSLDVLGFFVMFFIVFFAFAEVGYLVFGTQVEEFISFPSALLTLLRTILTDFKYTHIEKANRILSPLYFQFFIYTVFFLLMNIFLAIIFDNYQDVKTDIDVAPNEMQMTEYVQRGLFKFLRMIGCARTRKGEQRKELNLTMKYIRDALKKFHFSDIEIELFFSRYNIDPITEVEQRDMEKLLKDLEDILEDKPGRKDPTALEDYVLVDDFIPQQHKLDEIEKLAALLSTQVKLLLMKLERMGTLVRLKV